LLITGRIAIKALLVRFAVGRVKDQPCYRKVAHQ
jgi:hypothetical protein